ncbi:MAG: hypothetical protein IJR72_02625 [Oscillospiraceae bacterium]|nr:hypothetical protein [Oscillospiraceae bacterium]
MNDIKVKAVYEIPAGADKPERPAPPVTDGVFDERKLKEKLSEVLGALYNTLQTGNVFFDNYDVWIPGGLRGVLMENIFSDKLAIRLDWKDGSSSPFARGRGDVKFPAFRNPTLTLPTFTEAKQILDSLSKEERKKIPYLKNLFGSNGSKGIAVLEDNRYNSSHFCYEYSGGACQTIVAHVIHLSEPMMWYVLRNAMIPSGMDEKQKADLQSLYRMIERGFLNVENQEIVVTKALQNLKGEELQAALGSIADEVLNIPEDSAPVVPDKSQAAITELLRADFVRADITPENRRKLENPNGGLWELWERIRDNSDGETVRLETPVYARPPKLDVAWNDIIGIDFGTKSTVVARMTNGKLDLVRVGTGDYRSELSRKQYENPTILQFIDLDRFLTDFHARAGRPMTRWEDVNTSHTALNARNELSATDGPVYLPSFFGELKQWASGSRKSVHIMDRRAIDEKKPPKELRPFLESEEDAENSEVCYAVGMEEETPPGLNPIAFYAYYIGLYINNMRTGKIYLKYLLSFPVSYSKAARRKILESFEAGLKKSLPQSILDDRECMDSFYVREGAAEPAAYAVCALKKFGVKPEPGAPVRFAVFDFGGGTSDFDLGIWRRPENNERRRGVRYVIEHLSYGGSQHLGGENLLWEMACQTFRDNAGTLRKEGIQFTCPPWLTPEPGFEFLIDNTLEAQVNIRTLSELLRPVWEGNLKGDAENGYYTEGGAGGGYDIDVSGAAKIPLFNEDGAQKHVQINVSVPKLLELIRGRIEEGVTQFVGMVKAFALQWTGNGQGNSPVMDIFLAGNSAKSEIFRECIHARIDELNRAMRGIWGEHHRGDPPDTFFEIFAPLGSEEAERRIREDGAPDSEPQNCTGKTGVALGLLLTRSGSNIKAIDKTRTQEEIRFRFWVGESDDWDCLCPLLTPRSGYGQWVEYWDAGEEDFSFFYTDSPAAGTYQADKPQSGVSVWETRARQILIPCGYVNEAWHIYLRPVSPDEIECAVAESLEAAERGEYEWHSGAIRLE